MCTKINVFEPQTHFSSCKTKWVARSSSRRVRGPEQNETVSARRAASKNRVQNFWNRVLKTSNRKTAPGAFETILDRKRILFYIRSFFCESLRLQNHLQAANLLFGAPRFRFGFKFICFFIKMQFSPYKNLVFGNVFSVFLVQCCCFLLFFPFLLWHLMSH